MARCQHPATLNPHSSSIRRSKFSTRRIDLYFPRWRDTSRVLLLFLYFGADTSGCRIDGCPIHSVNCSVLSTLSLPQGSPLQDLALAAPVSSDNSSDLVLPVVSDERYDLISCEDDPAMPGCPIDDRRLPGALPLLPRQ